MSLKTSLGKLFLFAILQLGVLAGARFTQEEIEKILNITNRTRVVHIVKKDDDVR